MDHIRPPPWSNTAEQAVIGAAMLAPECIADLQAAGLREPQFFASAHRKIWRAVETLADLQRPVDVITVAEVLSELGALDDIGGLPYLGELAASVASAANAVDYGRVVMERAIERQWMVVGRSLVDVMQGEGSHQEKLDKAQALITGLASERRSSSLYDTPAVLRATVDLVDHKFRAEGDGIIGCRTGYKHIDWRLKGMRAGQLVLVAGRPSMGKTTYALNIATHAAQLQQRRVLFFSMEQPAHELGAKLISAMGPLNHGLIQVPKKFDDAAWQRLTGAVAKLRDAKLWIEDGTGYGAHEIVGLCRREHRSEPLGLVVIDYLQLLQFSESSRSTRADQIGHATRAFKLLARELECPVMLLSQVNRECEKRGNKRPIMSDLRDSGAIEQDADVVQFVYQPQVYNPESQDSAEIITAKIRGGERGTDYLSFDGAHSRFLEVEGTRAHQGDDAYDGYQY